MNCRETSEGLGDGVDDKRVTDCRKAFLNLGEVVPHGKIAAVHVVAEKAAGSSTQKGVGAVAIMKEGGRGLKLSLAKKPTSDEVQLVLEIFLREVVEIKS
jgi:hypothetical protein